MADYSLNGISLLDTRLTLHRVGCWTADVLTTDPSDPSLTAGLPASLSLNTMQCAGTILRGGTWRGSEYTRIVGGKGGLRLPATPIAYNGATWNQIVGALLSGVGESLSPMVNASLLSGTVDQWAVRGELTSVALTRVCDALGCVWRVLIDGTVWLGNDTWPQAVLTEPVLIDQYPERGELLVGITSPELLPGWILSLDGYGGNVSAVEYRIRGSGEMRMRVYLEDGT